MSTAPRPPSAPRAQTWRDVQPGLVEDDPRYTQGSLALSYTGSDQLAPGADSEGPWRSPLTLVEQFGVHDVQRSTTQPPDATAWAARFVQAVVEVISSDRPLSQLVRWTDEPVLAEIAHRKHNVMARRSADPQDRAGRQHVATVHVTQPRAGVAEVAARVTCRGRSRAIAARLDFIRDRWTCTAITFG